MQTASLRFPPALLSLVLGGLTFLAGGLAPTLRAQAPPSSEPDPIKEAVEDAARAAQKAANARAGLTDTTTFVGARLIDGTGGEPVENGVMVVRDGRILAIGRLHEVKAPEGARIVSLKGKTVIPGLICAHAHVGVTKGNTVSPENFSRDNVSTQLEQYERYGVTAVLSLGLNADTLYGWRDQQREGKFPGADIFTADRGFGAPNSAPTQAVGAGQVLRPATVEEARQQVREVAGRRPDLLKVWVDDLGGTTPKMAPEVRDALLDEARKANLRVAAHVFALEDARALVGAGVHVLAHSVRDRPVDEALGAAMKERGVVYVPTLALDEAQFVYAERPAWMTDPAFTRAVNPELLALWNGPDYAAKTAANPETPKHKAAAAMGLRNVKTLFDAGVVVALGTDSGGLPTRVPGWAEHRELQLLVQAGLKPMDALVCATRNAAMVLGDLKNRGTLEAGKRADFVILDANPLEDIRHTTRIDAVWHGGSPSVVLVKSDANTP